MFISPWNRTIQINEWQAKYNMTSTAMMDLFKLLIKNVLKKMLKGYGGFLFSLRKLLIIDESERGILNIDILCVNMKTVCNK